jgi:hypothetical protein
VELPRRAFLLSVYSGSKVFPTVLKTVCVCVPNRYFRDLNLFYIDFTPRNSPSARCDSAANAIRRDSGIFNGRPALIKDLIDIDTFTK